MAGSNGRRGSMPQHPELEDREHLERFLEWRRERRKIARRYTAGMALLAVPVAVLSTTATWYPIEGRLRKALSSTASVAVGPRVDTGSNLKAVTPAARLPVSRPESERGGSDAAASSAPVTAPEPARAREEAPSLPVRPTPAEATPARANTTSSLATSAAPPRRSIPAVGGPGVAAQRESLPPRRSAPVLRDAGEVAAPLTTPDVAALRPPEPAPIATLPAAPPSPAVVL